MGDKVSIATIPSRPSTTTLACADRGVGRPEHDAVVLIGNPNVGKSALFGALTGKYVTVSNYPGTTVEVTHGSAILAGRRRRLLDTPGANGLTPMSEDEQVTRDILFAERGCSVIQVCDARNLRRGLLLSVQLAEARVPFVLALNMSDEAKASGIFVDATKLSAALGVPVVETVAVQHRGVKALAESTGDARPSSFAPPYDDAIEKAVAEAQALLRPADGIDTRALALMVLAGDESLRKYLKLRLADRALAGMDELRRRLAARYPESLRYVIARQRLAVVDRLCGAVVSRAPARKESALLRRLSAWTTHPWLGIPILAAILLLCYEFVGVLGAKLGVDFLENAIFRQRLIPLLDGALRAVLPSGPIQELLVGPPGVPFPETAGFLIGRYGAISMGLSYGLAIVLPIVATFFLAFSMLEDTGVPPALGGDGEPGVQVDGPQWQSRPAHGAWAWVRHDGHDDRADYGD